MWRFGVLLGVLAVGVAPAAGVDFTGTIRSVVDGDTALVDVDGDVEGPVHVRNAGIQAMERGQCGADLATNALALALGTGVVNLRSDDPNATSVDGTGRIRPLRYMDTPAGTDVQLELVKQGLALAYPLGGELARQDAYHLAAQVAAQQGVGLYSRQLCAPGPAQEAQLRLWVNWDADGVDSRNLNGEYIRILNEGPLPVDLSSWWVRSPSPATFVFPQATVVNPGQTITVHSGSGAATATDLYWGGDSARFYNPTPERVHSFSAYLFDPEGDLRAWSMYPCTHACAEPLRQNTHLRWIAEYDPVGDESRDPNTEMLMATNIWTERIDLSYRVITMRGHVRELPGGSYLDPGETLSVHMGQGTPSRLHAYWGSTSTMLPNSGGAALLRSNDGVAIACAQWVNGGPTSARCSDRPTQAPTVHPPARKASVKVRATGNRSLLFVDVNPSKGRGSWAFSIQRRSATGQWQPLGTYRTRGAAETRTLNLPRGAYRVAVTGDSRYRGVTSGPVSLVR